MCVCVYVERCEYYVHYHGLDRRLDEWVRYAALDVNSIEDERKRTAAAAAHTLETERKVTRHMKRKVRRVRRGVDQVFFFFFYNVLCQQHDEENHVQLSIAEMDPTTARLEKEHEELTKVKYVHRIQLGDYEIDTYADNYVSPKSTIRAIHNPQPVDPLLPQMVLFAVPRLVWKTAQAVHL